MEVERREREKRRRRRRRKKERKRRKEERNFIYRCSLCHSRDFQVCIIETIRKAKIIYYFNKTGCHYWHVLPEVKKLFSESCSEHGLIPSRVDEFKDVFLDSLLD